jgi:hypothetical protein
MVDVAFEKPLGDNAENLEQEENGRRIEKNVCKNKHSHARYVDKIEKQRQKLEKSEHLKEGEKLLKRSEIWGKTEQESSRKNVQNSIFEKIR